MSFPENNVTYDQVVSLVADLTALSVTIPAGITSELAVRPHVRTAEAGRDTRVAAAKATMAGAFTKELFVTALDAYADVVNVENTKFGVREDVSDVLNTRLIAAVVAGTAAIQASLVTKYNTAVSANTLTVASAANLPPLGKDFDPLSLTSGQATALAAWKAGAEVVTPILNAYVKLAKLIGIDLENDAVALYFVLGDVVTVTTIKQATAMLETWNSNTDRVKAYGKLLPHLALPLNGVELKLKTTAAAVALRATFPGV